FYTNLDPASDVLIAQYATAAKRLAEEADLPSLVSCDPLVTGALPCAREFVETFGKRVYRRPLTAEEVSGYEELASWQLERADFASTIRLLLETMLQSPQFLYHLPNGEGAYAVASRLSFLILQRAPDDALLEAAERGELDDAAGIEAHVRSMLASPEGQAALVRFHSELLGLDDLELLLQDATAAPGLDLALLSSMREETETFVARVLADGGNLMTLLTADYTYADASAAALYGAAVEGDAPQRIALDPAQRAGLLTQPSLMALHHSPVRRGLFINETLLCADIPPPPPSVDTIPPEPVAGLPPREQWLSHITDPACASCHELIDPLGFAFDHYDASGRWQDQKGGFPVDASGTVDLLSGKPGFEDAVGLAAILANSEQVQECIASHWVAYVLGRPLSDADRCLVEDAQARLSSSGFDIVELFVAITVGGTP
ncbi:MAG TPA: DUF1592 domain-containing protein, partial [Polyangiaceae bacterium]|nr:DUF1592 domain-containing protein [Polyangiaceae bacterium]